jgi:pSer/pThr/pTyr-binding forkhead associated (FHA) protein
VLGRAGDVQLEDPSMPRLLSRKHCRLVFQSDGNLEVEDLGSINGTFVQRPGSEPQRLSAHVPQPLQPEDTLLLGGQEQVNDFVNNRPVPNPFVFLVCPAGAAQQDTVGLGGFNTASSSEQHQQVQEEVRPGYLMGHPHA